jgi:hypothetical protein
VNFSTTFVDKIGTLGPVFYVALIIKLLDNFAKRPRYTFAVLSADQNCQPTIRSADNEFNKKTTNN